MLLNIIKNIFSRRSAPQDDGDRLRSQAEADALRERGEIRAAIAAYRKHLEIFPFDVDILNNLGCCLIDLGEHEAAGEQFELAFALDDTYKPALANYARHLLLQKKSDDSMRYLRIAKTYNHDDPSVHTILSSFALLYAEGDKSHEYGLRAWLGQFDELRAANCFLFNSTYADIDERVVAAEHRFWAETLKPLDAAQTLNTPPAERHFQFKDLPPKDGRVRVAYWSPDFRGHSVRYFFLPMLEGHDREHFEIIGYYDLADKDEITERIAASCDHFMWVNEMPDAELMKMIRSHDVDILVELSGHSSSNRLDLLRERLAKRQVTGIGYPPTTGLASIDAKLLDKYVVTEESAQYFTEYPLALANSFWCFDPQTDVPINPEPPVCRNGYITFGCIGNIGKITRKMLASWRVIMERLPTCRIVVRSISFTDAGALREFRVLLEHANMDTARIDLLGPLGYEQLLNAYNDIDIILDTFPFNGGTTTCFGTYMGVPVVSLAGDSLTGRMGLSVLSNLGLQDWVAHDFDEYAKKAVQHTSNTDFLMEFRKTAREKYQTTSLGNGQLFARDLEAGYRQLLDMPLGSYRHQVPVVAGDELVRRAMVVMSYGNFEAAERIIDYCLKAYPDHGHAQVLWTHGLTSQGKFSEAIDHLESVLARTGAEHQFILLLNIARFSVVAGMPEKARSTILHLLALSATTEKEQAYQRLCGAYLAVANLHLPSPVVTEGVQWLCKEISKFCVVVVGRDEARYRKIVSSLRSYIRRYQGVQVSFVDCDDENKCASYKRVLSQSGFDAFIIIHQNIDIVDSHFFEKIAASLLSFDVVGFGGVKVWDRLAWRTSPSDNKAIAFLAPSGEKEGFVEINHLGVTTGEVVPGMSLLDGRMLALRFSSLQRVDLSAVLDPLLEGGGAWLEECMAHSAYQAGLTLAVHQNVGVLVDWSIPVEAERVKDARLHIVEKMGFDPFMEEGEDKSSLSITLPTVQLAVDTMDMFFNKNGVTNEVA